MRRFLVSLVLSMFVGAAAAGPVAESAPESVDLRYVELNKFVSLYFMEISKRPYVVCSDVLGDSRMVSLRGSGKTLTGPLFASMLAEYGYEAKDRGGVTVVCKKKEVEAAPEEEEGESFFYRVKHRDSSYLVDLVSPLVKGTFANKRSSGGALAVGGQKVQATGSATSTAQQPVQQGGSVGSSFQSSGDDFILFSGAPKQVARLKSLLAQVDTPTGEVVVKAYMYEVGSSDSDASAISLLLSALGGKFQAGVAGTDLGSFLRIKTSSIDLVASALKTDGRFKVVTSPYQRVKSGKSARFVSGSQVAVVGSIVTNQNGSTQQSFDRVDSGTILEISPVVRDEGVDLDVFQQVSSFVKSDVSTQPTLNKREMRSTLTVQDGEVVVIGGLDDSKEDDTRSGLSFLPFSLSKSKSTSRSQLVLVLEVKKI